MKKNFTSYMIIFVFSILMGGAYVLYNTLSQGASPDQLAVIYGQTAEHTDETENETAEPTNVADTVESTKSDDPDYVSAPDFTVYDLAGNEVHLSDYIGKPIVLNFWASWCGPCQSEMPDFNEAYAELGEEIQFLMINLTTGRETLESASSFIEKNEYSFPVFYDTELEAASAYGAYSLPTTFFINSDGQVIAQATGAIRRETLQKGIDMIFPE